MKPRPWFGIVTGVEAFNGLLVFSTIEPRQIEPRADFLDPSPKLLSTKGSSRPVFVFCNDLEDGTLAPWD